MLLTILLSVIVTASVDSTVMTLGDQTGLHLEVQCAPDEFVQFPVFGKELTEGIEIVEQSSVDSSSDNSGKHYKQDLLLTSFNDSLFFVSPIPFVCGEDTVFSDGLTLNFVQPFEIDSTIAITDIRPIKDAPIWWWGIIRWILGLLLLTGVLILVGWLLNKIGHYEGRFIPRAAREPERPAEEVALEALDRIREEKIWTQGQTKAYHTELTDVLRTYIAKRFGIASTEKTSDETLQAMKPILLENGKAPANMHAEDGRLLYGNLLKVLQQADLVKFAKWQTTPDENETALRIAYEFVNETKPVAEPQQDENEQIAK